MTIVLLYGNQFAIHPPSTTSISPVTYEEALLAKNTAGPTNSSGFAHRPNGIRPVISWYLAVSVFSAAVISVSQYPGAIALTNIPLLAQAFEQAFVSWSIAPFEDAYAGVFLPP